MRQSTVIGVEAINRAAAELAKSVAAEGDALVLGGLSQCPSYLSGKGKEAVQKEFKKQIDVFVDTGMDFLLCEVGEHLYKDTVFDISCAVF